MATVVVKDVGGADLTIGDRDFVVLTGPDAAAISEIVRDIVGVGVASHSEIRFDDHLINGIAPKDRDIAFLSHDYEPYPRLSAYENLAISLKRRRFGDAEIKKRIDAVAAELGIQHRLEVPGHSLLRSDRAFLGLARAMVRQPRVYLFDRPFADLQASEATRGRAAIAGLRQRSSATIIYATNDPAEALALDARTVIIVAGSVQQDGPAQTIYDSPANLAVAKFFGDPPMNLVRGTMKIERDGVVFLEEGEGTISVNLPEPRFSEARDLEGKRAVLAFRAESLGITGGEASHRHRSTFRALVERAEPKGAQTELYLRTGAHDLICRTGVWEAEGGRRLQFEIDLQKAHLFDPETGRRVSAEG
jgi:multiple sugar transport system ATP-binding protein